MNKVKDIIYWLKNAIEMWESTGDAYDLAMEIDWIIQEYDEDGESE